MWRKRKIIYMWQNEVRKCRAYYYAMKILTAWDQQTPMHQLFQIAIYQAITSILKKGAKDDVKEAWTFYHFCEKFQNDTIVLILQECDLNKHNIPDSKRSLLDLAKGETHKFGKANVEGVLTNTNNGMFWQIKTLNTNVWRSICFVSNAIKQVNLRRQILSSWA